MLSFSQFRAMRSPMRALVYLYWIQTFVMTAIQVFAQIYVYELFYSVQFNILTLALSFTGLMLGFCVYGALAAHWRLNTRHGFLLSFLMTGIGIGLLSVAKLTPLIDVAVLVIGIGAGLFWLTIHTYELVETRDNERDVYSTYLSAGGQLLSLAAPAFATILIAIADFQGWNEFALLFSVTPFIYLLGFFFFGSLTDYHPAPIVKQDVIHFITNRRNQVIQLYLWGGAAHNILERLLIPIVSIIILGTTLSVGGFNTIFAVVSTLALLVVGTYRHTGNRLLILGTTSLLIAGLYVILGASFTFVALVLYTLGYSLLGPMMRVSQHVIDLQTMDSIGRKESDFYPTMILRDFSLWIWRIITVVILYCAVTFSGTDKGSVSLGLYFTAAAYVIMYVGARVVLASRPKQSPEAPLSS